MVREWDEELGPVVLVFSALVRPGRFDMQVTVPRPDVKGRTEILNWYLSKIKVDPGRSQCRRPPLGPGSL